MMSFLDELCTKRQSLKPTVTVLTYPDGRKFEEFSPETRSEVPKAQFGFIVDTKPDDVPAKIIDFLFLGSQDCCGLDTLQKYNITHVLSVGIEAPHKYDHIVYKFVHCLDLPETNLQDILEETTNFIEVTVQKRYNILVHCNAGVSRSASIVIGYLMLVSRFNYSDAYSVVKKARSCIRPNNGFVEQLKKISGSVT